MMSDAELYDRFVHWLDDKIENYTSTEIDVLWEEFQTNELPNLLREEEPYDYNETLSHTKLP